MQCAELQRFANQNSYYLSCTFWHSPMLWSLFPVLIAFLSSSSKHWRTNLSLRFWKGFRLWHASRVFNNFTQCSVHWTALLLCLLMIIWFIFDLHVVFTFFLIFCGVCVCVCVCRLELCDSAAALSSPEASGLVWSSINQRGRTMVQ